MGGLRRVQMGELGVGLGCMGGVGMGVGMGGFIDGWVYYISVNV